MALDKNDKSNKYVNIKTLLEEYLDDCESSYQEEDKKCLDLPQINHSLQEQLFTEP